MSKLLPMSLKSTPEVEKSFRRVEQMLDSMLEETRAYLELERIAVRDSSNRSGFDGGGFPSFTWAYQFEKRTPYGSEIKSSVARLWYREPVYEDEIQRIEVTSVAQIFQIGKLSRVSEKKEWVCPIEKFLNMKMDQVIMDCFAVSEQVLVKY